MNEETNRRSKKSFMVDLTPLSYSRAFKRLWLGGAVSQIGANMTTVAVGMHVYDLTKSTFAVSLLALWAIGPMIIAGLWGGMIADAFDRRKVSLISASISWISITTLAIITFSGGAATLTLYILASINAASSTIMWTTKSAIMPRLLTPQLLPAASALHGIGFGVSVTVGPALAGILASSLGFAITYSIDAVLFTAGFLGIFTLPAITPEGKTQKPGLKSLLDGIRFLKKSPNIRATFTYDIIAMSLGQPRVLYPAAGTLVLGGGYTTAGLLSASVAVGALISSLTSGWLGRVQKHGKAVTLSILCYGATIVSFGAVLLYALLTGGAPNGNPRYALIAMAFIALALSGAADNISAIFRSTILQVAAPDNMRGRLQGISTVVVTGGPRVGDMFAGSAAAALALWAPPLIGGAAIVIAMAILTKTAHAFLQYSSQNPKP